MYDMSYPSTTNGTMNSPDNYFEQEACGGVEYGNSGSYGVNSINGVCPTTSTGVYCPQINYTQSHQMNYGQTDPAYQQCYGQQQYSDHQNGIRGLGCYVPGYQQDYPDINSLEPTLIPNQLNGTDYSYQMVTTNGLIPSYHNNSPTASSHTSTGSDESEDYYSWHPYKRSPPAPVELDGRTKRGKQTKKRKPKRDPNEPQKPVSAYALFFRDTQAAIKGQNPNASFGEVSKIVASMWDNLDLDAKNNYKQKTETAKKDYLKQLAAYRANLLSKNGVSPVLDSMGQHHDLSNAQQKLLNQTQTSPDSTTAVGPENTKDSSINGSNVGEKSLASLIAEPTPHQVLTATTTLTVPQSYVPVRNMKTDYGPLLAQEFDGTDHSVAGCRSNSFDRDTNIEQSPPWKAEFCPNEGLVQHCRDVFSIWGQPRQQQHSSVPQPNYAHV